MEISTAIAITPAVISVRALLRHRFRKAILNNIVVEASSYRLHAAGFGFQVETVLAFSYRPQASGLGFILWKLLLNFSDKSLYLSLNLFG